MHTPTDMLRQLQLTLTHLRYRSCCLSLHRSHSDLLALRQEFRLSLCKPAACLQQIKACNKHRATVGRVVLFAGDLLRSKASWRSKSVSKITDLTFEQGGSSLLGALFSAQDLYSVRREYTSELPVVSISQSQGQLA